MDRGTVYPAVGTHSPTRQTFSAGSGIRRFRAHGSANDDVISEKDVRPANVAVYLAVCLFTLSGNLPTRALWMELPVLIRKVPEGRTLALYLLIVLESANVAALAYLVAKRFAKERLSEIPVIYSCFALGLISLTLTGCFWNHTTLILGQPSSFALLLSAFLAAIVSAVSVVTYIPFAARLREPYVTAVFLGDVLGAVVPHLLTLAQGITRSAPCPGGRSVDSTTKEYTKSSPLVLSNGSVATDVDIQTDDDSAQYAQGQLSPYVVATVRSTLALNARHLELRFSEYGYFFLCAALLVLGIVSFVLLRWCRLCQFEYAEPFVDRMDDVEMNPGIVDEADDDVWQTSCDGLRSYAAPADRKKDGSCPRAKTTSPVRIRTNSGGRTTSPSRAGRGRYVATQRPRFASSGSECTASVANSDATSRPASFPLLIAITFWTTAILAGPLSTDKVYACFPAGNTPFLVGTLLCDIAVITTCIAAARTASRDQVTIVIALCCLGTILLTYFVALIAFSRESESREQSPLYGRAGEMLTAIAWTAITALFSYVRVTIGALCRQTSINAIHWYAYTTLFGTAVGTVTMINDISVCQVFKDKELTC